MKIEFIKKAYVLHVKTKKIKQKRYIVYIQ
jgi:hypothetical protein